MKENGSMAAVVKVTEDGKPGGALGEKELGFDKITGELFVGSGNGIADGTIDTADAGEIQVTRNADIVANLNGLAPFNGYTKEKQDMRFETSSSNILSVGNMNDSYVVDGKVVGTLGEELATDMTSSNWSQSHQLVTDLNDGVFITNSSYWTGAIFNLQDNLVLNKLYQIRFSYANATHEVAHNTGTADSLFPSGSGVVYDTFIKTSEDTEINLQLVTDTGSVEIYNISVREISTIDLNTTNDRTGFNGEGYNSFVPEVTVIGFDPISTGSITGTDVAIDAQIGDVLDNIPAQSANTRIKCRINPTTDGIRVDILNKSDGDSVVRTQTTTGVNAQTLEFTLPVNDDGYKVKVTKITNDGSGDESITVTAEVSTGLVVDGKVKRGDYVVVDTLGELVDITDYKVTHDAEYTLNGTEITIDGDTANYPSLYLPFEVVPNNDYKLNELIVSNEDILYSRVYSYPTEQERDDDENGTPFISHTIASGSSNTQINDIINTSATYCHLTFWAGTADNKTYTIDNISVKLANDTYKAIEDTNDGDSLANATKFKPADYISNQIQVMMKQDGTYTQEVLMNDAYAKESTTETLTNNGFSSLGGGLFSKGGDVVVPVGRWQT